MPHGSNVDREVRPGLSAITQAADDAKTVEDALRAALARICEHAAWQAGRLQFSSAAGELAGRSFWHLERPEQLTTYRSIAETRRQDPGSGLTRQVLAQGGPLWTLLPAEVSGARGVVAFPIRAFDRIFAVLEFYSGSAEPPAEALLQGLVFVCAELGRILQRKPAEDELRRSEREYRALFESAHDAILIVDPHSGVILDANQRGCELYGCTREEIVALPLSSLWSEPDHARLMSALFNPGLRFEARQQRRDGTAIFVEVVLGPVELRGRRAVWMSSRDVTERKRFVEALAASEERYRRLFESSPQAMWAFDQESLRFLAVNEAAVARYGYSRAEFAGMRLDDLRGPDDGTGAHERLRRGEAGSLVRHVTKGGALIDVEVSSHEIDFNGKSARLVVANDVTERLLAEEKLWHAAFYDALTGLPNRALFMERLGQAQARARGRKGCGFAVLFLDLDRFKVVNDSLGHRAGDQLLLQIARRLLGTRRAGDTVARLGGDEFSFLVEGIEDAADASRVAERMQRELAAPFEIAGQEVFTSASIGIALGGSATQRPEDLLRDADTAMYRAKAQGTALHTVFDAAMHEQAVAVLQLENDLRRAIDRSELRLQYQPIVALSTGRIVGFEALVRWQHRLRGLVLPVDFIPMAEETGLICPVGKWVLEEACSQMRELQLAHPRETPLSLSVNLSGRQVLQPGLVDEIGDILRRTGFAAQALRLEITETVLVENAQAASRCLGQLRGLGLQLVIDDFGTGYSSLSYLHRMPIDLLKIDASFVRTMGVDEKNRQIVETILVLGTKLGLAVVAEGVETVAQANALYRLGCALAQGHLFSESVDLREARALLSAEAAAPAMTLGMAPFAMKLSRA